MDVAPLGVKESPQVVLARGRIVNDHALAACCGRVADNGIQGGLSSAGVPSHQDVTVLDRPRDDHSRPARLSERDSIRFQALAERPCIDQFRSLQTPPESSLTAPYEVFWDGDD